MGLRLSYIVVNYHIIEVLVSLTKFKRLSMNLQLTKKLSDKLKVDLVEIDTTTYSDIDNYHCNLV